MRVPGPLAADARSLDALKTGAASDPKGAARLAASQFEALFMQMVLKSMRDSVPRGGMLDGPGADIYRGMLDSQLAQSMTGRPGGLSDLIARQLLRSMRIDDGATARDGAASDSAPDSPDSQGAAETTGMPDVSTDGLVRALAMRNRATPPAFSSDGVTVPRAPVGPASTIERASSVLPAGSPAAVPAGVRAATGVAPSTDAAAAAARRPSHGSAAQAAFVDRMWPAALAAERATGVPAGFVVGQAALESGWGRQEIRHPDGRSAHNLFGIKAGPGWRGEVVEATTTEWVDGRPVKSVERFRAYGDHAEAFADWSRLMATSPRYGAVLRAGGSIESFATNLQRAGYATDPDYASKLTRTIVTALSLRRADT